MNIRLLGFVLVSIILGACSTTKKQAKFYEQTKPEWVKQRPTVAGYYIGIGIAPKNGAEVYYIQEAKKRSLADLIAQINTHVESETQLYTYENNQGVSDYIQRRIKATSTEFIEGYQLVDQWEDLDYVYAYYKLSKQEFIELKNKRRQEALSNAKTKFIKAQEFEEKYQLVEALSLFANCIDILSGYMNQENTINLNGSSIDVILESENRIKNIIQQIDLEPDTEQIETRVNEVIKEGSFSFFVKNVNGQPIASVPVKFAYSNGFLLNDLGKSNNVGFVASPQITIGTIKSEQQLSANINLVLLGRQMSRNLYVRNLVEDLKTKKVFVTVKVF